ncbi:MAG TPA: lysylphosphatidylglycerol synthase domain-containing protein [Gemmatimonadales bacterium]|jgi:phosphatidylglycerol lysyltransferase
MAPRGKPRGWKRWIGLVINLLLFGVALGVLKHVLTEYKLADIITSLHRIGWPLIAASLGLTVLGYGALVGYDYLSLRIAGHPIPIRRMWSASFISHAVQNSAPIAIVAGGGVRYRLFRRLGVSGTETAAVVAGNLLTFVIGLFAVAGLSFVLAPVAIPDSFHLPVTSLRPVGIVFLVAVVGTLVAAELGVASVRIFKWRLELPKGGMLREQLGVSVADWLLSSAALYVLMVAAGPVSFPQFLSGFLLAQIVTQVVPLPGGIGVFEAAILLLRPHDTAAPLVTAALLLYRVIYYLVPLFFATAILALESSRKPNSSVSPATRVAREVAPHLFAVLTFITGCMLLVFDILPGGVTHIRWIGNLLQIALIEGSHFIGSLVGTGLILLAFGLERELRSAFHLTVAFLLLGIPAAILGAGDVRSAAILIVLLLLLLTARNEFTRTIPFTAEPLNAGWVGASIVAVLGIGWLGIYLQVRHEYTRSLWWRFALDDGAPRALRATLGVLLAVAVFVIARLVTRARRSGHIVRRRAGRPRATSRAKTKGRAAPRRS